MGITKRGGHSLTGIYLNVRELKVKIFKYSISVPNKLTETKRLLGKLVVSLRGTQNICKLVRHCFQEFTYRLEWNLVIHKE